MKLLALPPRRVPRRRVPCDDPPLPRGGAGSRSLRRQLRHGRSPGFEAFVRAEKEMARRLVRRRRQKTNGRSFAMGEGIVVCLGSPKVSIRPRSTRMTPTKRVAAQSVMLPTGRLSSWTTKEQN
ncbi:hypothetical protein MRX96_033685 [Rhipicephalus microplus]